MPLPKRRSSLEWYIEPTGDRAIANQHLAPALNLSADETMTELKDKNGKGHPVWPCTWEQALQIWKSLDDPIELWSRARNYGPIERKTFLLQTSPGKRAAAKEAAKAVRAKQRRKAEIPASLN